jgi:hypothetical protein
MRRHVNFEPTRARDDFLLPTANEPRSEGEVPALFSKQRIRVTADHSKLVYAEGNVAEGSGSRVVEVSATHREHICAKGGVASAVKGGVVTEVSTAQTNVVKVTKVAVQHTSNTTRDGIDVISLTGGHRRRLSKSVAEESPSAAQTPHHASDVIHLTPHSTGQTPHHAAMTTSMPSAPDPGNTISPERDEGVSPPGPGLLRDTHPPLERDEETSDEDISPEGRATTDAGGLADAIKHHPTRGSTHQLEVRIPTMLTQVTVGGSQAPLLDETSSVEEEITGATQSLEAMMSSQNTGGDGGGQQQGEITSLVDDKNRQQINSPNDSTLQYASYSLSFSGTD